MLVLQSSTNRSSGRRAGTGDILNLGGVAPAFVRIGGGSLAHGGGLLLLREVVPVDDGVVYRHSTSLLNGYRQVG